MPDWPNTPPLPLFVHTWSRWGPIMEASRFIGGGILMQSITWPVANTAFYMPVTIPWPYPVRRVFWINGTSTTTTNMDFGIYTASGTQIYHTGSTAEGTASTTQYVTPTAFMLYPGQYYFALSCSSISAARGGQGDFTITAPRLEMAGLLQEASALPLPATMTPAAVANSCLPLCGITRTTTGF